MEQARRPRVVFFAAAWPPYTAAEADHALQECLHLAEQDICVHVVTNRRDDVARPQGVSVHPVVENWSWTELLKLWRLIRRIRPHAGMMFFLGYLYNYKTMPTFLPALVKLAAPGARFVTQFPNLGEGAPEGNSLRLRLQRWLFAHLGRLRYGSMLILSDRLLVMSHRNVRHLARIHPSLAARTRLLPPPPLFPLLPADGLREPIRKRLGLPQDAFVFMFFGRLYPAKGIESLLRAFAQLKPELPGIRLAMIGGYHSADAWWQRNSYPDELNALVRSLDVKDDVVWSGEYDWDSTDATEYLRAADVAVLPLERGVRIGNSSLAAVMAHGLPTVVTRPGGNPDPEIIHNENAYVIPAGDEAALVEAMRTLYEDAGLRSGLQQGADVLAHKWFSWDTCTTTIRANLGI
jgi:glycosyltransferase involved in cell wall biosynthesis